VYHTVEKSKDPRTVGYFVVQNVRKKQHPRTFRPMKSRTKHLPVSGGVFTAVNVEHVFLSCSAERSIYSTYKMILEKVTAPVYEEANEEFHGASIFQDNATYQYCMCSS